MYQLSERELAHNIRLLLTHKLFLPYFYDDQGNRQTPVLIVDNSPVINAFARNENGQFKIGITTALIYKIHEKAREKNMDPSDIIRAVFGHELSHCAKEDFSKLNKSTLFSIVLLVPICIFSLHVLHPLMSIGVFIAGVLAIRARYYKQYQKNEFRCDKWGASVSSREAMLALLEIIQENKVSWWDKFLNLFKFHPLTEARIANIRGVAYGT